MSESENASIPRSQRAWLAVQRGPPAKCLRLQEDYPVPSKLEPGEVLVKVQAASLNPGCWKLMMAVPNFLARRPIVPELDMSAVVVDPNETRFSKGDAVFAFIPLEVHMKTKQGVLQQYARFSASLLNPQPDNVTPIEAAGLTSAALTSYQALFKYAKLEEGQRIFINGGSSSLGSFAIQLAKSRGCYVGASASGKNEEYVRAFGVDYFIDYTAGPLHEHLASAALASQKYHVVFDAAGLVDPSLYTHSEAYLAPGGIFIHSGPVPTTLSLSEICLTLKTIAAVWRPRWAGGVNRDWRMVMVKQNREDFENLTSLIASGKLKPVIDSIYPFEKAIQGYERVMTMRARGKVIIKVDESAA